MPKQPEFDHLIQKIADYVINFDSPSQLAIDTARHCLIDTLGCGILALHYPACTKHLGPIVEGTIVPNAVRVPGTNHLLDPIKGAWDIGCMVRWLDFNDTWLAAEWGHPSDNLGGILSVCDYLSQKNSDQAITIETVLKSMIKAHEIQGALALENSFNRVGLDHVLLVKLATTAVVTHLLGGSREQILNAISHAWIDGQSLRTYRHAPNTMSRKSWAAGDASSRGVKLAMMCLKGESGIPSALTAPIWGFQDVLFKGEELKLNTEFKDYVMENILFKISFPAEFHAQTAVEAAINLHQCYQDKLNQIKRIHMLTHESAVRIISKTGGLNNPADRDHCLQYMTAVGLLEGQLKAEHYEDSYHHSHPEIDQLREKMVIEERQQYSIDYLDKDKRSIANAITLEFEDGTKSELEEVEYPIGHKRRREEGIPKLIEKFESNIRGFFQPEQAERITNTCLDSTKLDAMEVKDFMKLWVT